MAQLTRRQWLKTGALATAGLALGRQVSFSQDAGTTMPIPKVSEYVRLHSNENPLGPFPSAQQAMIESFKYGYRYPREHYTQLQALIAEREGLTPDHVMLGAGSHEVLRVAGVAYGLEGGEVITGYPTYEGFERYAKSIGGIVHRVPLEEDFNYNLAEMDRKATRRIKMVFICNPNNPTGIVVEKNTLRNFCEEVSKRTVVMVDEAYHEYVTDPNYASMVDLVKRGENVIISRTFSKIYGLAGLRVGYALARPDLIRQLDAYRTSAGINVVGVAAAIASMKDQAFEARSREENTAAQQYVYRLMNEMGHRYLESSTNFVFFELGRPVQPFAQEMYAQGIRVGRPFPPYTDWCRLSMSTMNDMEAFGRGFRNIMAP